LGHRRKAGSRRRHRLLRGINRSPDSPFLLGCPGPILAGCLFLPKCLIFENYPRIIPHPSSCHCCASNTVVSVPEFCGLCTYPPVCGTVQLLSDFEAPHQCSL
jgi:hypothetical protein